MNDEHFPVETLLNASAMFEFLDSKSGLQPAEMELEWVFGINAPFVFKPERMDPFFEVIEDVFAEYDAEENLINQLDENSLRAEVHVTGNSDDSEFPQLESNDPEESSELLLVYAGLMTQQQLEKLHTEFSRAAEAIGAEYIGAECGVVGELDDLKVDSFIHWTDELLEETANWNYENLSDMADSMREQHIEALRDRGLEVATWMPNAASRGFTQLRPHDEIARRLMAAFATVAWVCAPDDIVSAADVKKYLADNELERESFSQKETDWLATPRDKVRESIDEAGWILENVWGLAWLLGVAPTVCPCDQQVPQSIVTEIREDFLCEFGKTVDELVTGTTLQPVERIIALEDFLFCAHNGLRNIDDVVAAGFIQERRHALTWALSPGVDWDDADIST